MIKCPICKTITKKDNQDYCFVCGWEFEYYFSELSSEEKERYAKKVTIHTELYKAKGEGKKTNKYFIYSLVSLVLLSTGLGWKLLQTEKKIVEPKPIAAVEPTVKIVEKVVEKIVYVDKPMSTKEEKVESSTTNMVNSSLLAEELKLRNNQLSLYKNDQLLIKLLYKTNNYEPLWIKNKTHIKELRKALKNIYFNYKHKNLYQSEIKNYSDVLATDMSEDKNSRELISLDIALTKSYIALIRFIVKGDIDWNRVKEKVSALEVEKNIEANWEMIDKDLPKASEILQSLKTSKITTFLHSLIPLSSRHKNLINDLKLFNNLNGKFSRIKYAKDLKRGDSYPYISDIKRYLILTKDLPNKSNTNNLFDEELEDALKLYKSRFKLEQDGIIDKITVYYMNKPISKHIQAIITNLDKLKVYPSSFQNEYIQVNLPDFTLDYYKNGSSVLSLKVDIGRDISPSPISFDTINFIELNPYYHIRDNSLVAAIKELRKNNFYCQENNIHIFNKSNPSKELENFDISKLFPYEKSSKDIPYKLIQFPGENNALGKLKFSLSKNKVHLQDTQYKDVFNRRYRLFDSDGDISVQDPFSLIRAIGKKYLNKTINSNSSENSTINLRKKLPINMVYFTVFNRNGKVFFRKDIYEYDKFIEESVILD